MKKNKPVIIHKPFQTITLKNNCCISQENNGW